MPEGRRRLSIKPQKSQAKVKIVKIYFKTDNRGLFEFSLESITNYGFKIKNVCLDLHNTELDFINVKTEFEEKYGANSPIYRLEAYR